MDKQKIDKLIEVTIKTIKILKEIIKFIFKILDWCWKKSKGKRQNILAVILLVGCFMYLHAFFQGVTVGVEVCDGSKGMFTIEEDGYVANNLVKRCKGKKQIGKVIFPEGYNSPKDLFYVFLKEDRTQVSQSQKEHFRSNGYLATDIATNKKSIDVYAPSFMYLDETGKLIDSEVDYILSVAINTDTTGLTAVLTEKDTNRQFIIGHMAYIEESKIGKEIRTGDVIGKSGGCPENLLHGEKSTGCHVHLEYWVGRSPVPFPQFMFSNHGEQLERYRLYKETLKQENREDWGLALREDDKIYAENNSGYKLLPFIISAQHLQETGRCIDDCPVSNAGARGAMQFMKNTWYEYGCDGNADGLIDVENLEDSMCGASNYMAYLFEEKGRGQKPNQHWKWQWWRAFYIYNAGYDSEPTHTKGIPSAVRYADNILNLALSLSR